MIERVTTGVFGKPIIEFFPENDEDMARLEEMERQGRGDLRDSFGDFEEECVPSPAALTRR